jgi:hypothetical protein
VHEIGIHIHCHRKNAIIVAIVFGRRMRFKLFHLDSGALFLWSPLTKDAKNIPAIENIWQRIRFQ